VTRPARAPADFNAAVRWSTIRCMSERNSAYRGALATEQVVRNRRRFPGSALTRARSSGENTP